jgi:hypothetical protein
MELKNINLHGGNVIASNLNNINIYFLKIVKIKFKNKHHVLFFLQDVMIACKRIPHIVHFIDQHQMNQSFPKLYI